MQGLNFFLRLRLLISVFGDLGRGSYRQDQFRNTSIVQQMAEI